MKLDHALLLADKWIADGNSVVFGLDSTGQAVYEKVFRKSKCHDSKDLHQPTR